MKKYKIIQFIGSIEQQRVLDKRELLEGGAYKLLDWCQFFEVKEYKQVKSFMKAVIKKYNTLLQKKDKDLLITFRCIEVR